MLKTLMSVIGILLLGLGILSPFISNSSDPLSVSRVGPDENPKKIAEGADVKKVTGENGTDDAQKKEDSGNNYSSSPHPMGQKVESKKIDSIRVASIVLPIGGGLVLLACLFGASRTEEDRFSGWLFTSSLTVGLVGILMFMLAVERADEISRNHSVLNLFLSAALCFLFVGFVGLIKLGSQPDDTPTASTS